MRIFIIVFSFLVVLSSCSPVKKIKRYKANNMILEEYYVLRKDQSIKERKYVYYFRGSKLVEGSYLNNRKAGEWHYHDARERLNFSGSYKEGKKDKKWTYYYDGKLSSEIFYNEDNIDSVKGYHKDGTIAYELIYLSDSSGLSRSFYPNGNLEEVIQLNHGAIDGVCKIYFENGQLHQAIEFREGRKMSVVETFDQKGRKLDGGTLKDGQGTYIAYFIDGKSDTGDLKVCLTREYKDGLKDGFCQRYRENGTKLVEGFYKDNYVNGEWKTFKEDGSVNFAVTYDSKVEREEALANFEPGLFCTIKEDEKHMIDAEFQGGEKQRQRFLAINLRYPEKAKANGVEGSVIVSTIISPTGELGDLEVIKSTDNDMASELIRVVELMPRWNPVLSHGVPIHKFYYMPVRFSLK